MSDHVTSAQSTGAAHGRASVGKVNYQKFTEALKATLQDDEVVRQVLDVFCKEFNFSPDVSTYSAKKGKQYSEWRRKKAEEIGCSVYQVSAGNKKKS